MRPRSIAYVCGAYLAVALAAAGALGCDEELVTPPSVAYPFSMYGVLTPDLDTQAVLIYPVEGTPTVRPPAPLDAAVTSTDLVTGEVRVWRDSVTVDPVGLYEHVFWSEFAAVHDHRYRLDVRRPSDGATSQVEVIVPPRAEVLLDDSRPARQILYVIAEDVKLLNVAMRYVVVKLNRDGRATIPFEHILPYGNQAEEVQGGWGFEISLPDDYAIVRRAFSYALIAAGAPPLLPEDRIAFVSLTLKAVVADEAWDPPGGVFDFDVLSLPGLMSNVEGGFGFVGGGYRQEQKLYPSREALERAGFTYVPGLVK